MCILTAAPAARAGVSMGTIEEDPVVVKQRQLDKAEADYKEGMKARAAGDASNAVRLLLRVAETEKHGLRSPYAPKAFDELKVIFEEAQKDLQVARQLVAGEDPAAGLSELKRIMRTYMGLGPAKEAGTLARQLEGDAQFQATLKSGRLAEDLKKAEALEAQAAAALDPPKPEAEKKPDPSKLPTAPPPAPMPEGVGAVNVRPKELTPAERQAARIARLLEAYDLYGRIAAQGPDSGPGKKAAEARARLEKDADLMARIELAKAERKARELMSLAENYYRAGRFDSAREYCRKVISTYPQTVQASDAKTLLERMK
jgi:tetratricopeptide (TPR) repeat protein